MSEELGKAIDNMWLTIEERINRNNYTNRRVYQRLDLEGEAGIRLGMVTPGNVRELLIQLAPNDKANFVPPRWAGMGFEIIMLDIPDKGTRHIRLYLAKPEYKSIFTTVCADIINSLIGIEKSGDRTVKLSACLDKWSSFFQKYGLEGLSKEAQRGLFGEIFWIQRLISSGMDKFRAIESWYGCRGGYHDFEFNKIVVEVKTTISKEPRRIRINNERQLDDRGFDGLFLYVLTLHPVLSGGMTLPELIGTVRSSLSGDISAEASFEQSLRDAGYIDVHEPLYDGRYIVKVEEIFRVNKGFPRIIDLPSGTGDISYSLMISACSEFLVDLDNAIKIFSGGD